MWIFTCRIRHSAPASFCLMYSTNPLTQKHTKSSSNPVNPISPFVLSSFSSKRKQHLEVKLSVVSVKFHCIGWFFPLILKPFTNSSDCSFINTKFSSRATTHNRHHLTAKNKYNHCCFCPILIPIATQQQNTTFLSIQTKYLAWFMVYQFGHTVSISTPSLISPE